MLSGEDRDFELLDEWTRNVFMLVPNASVRFISSGESSFVGSFFFTRISVMCVCESVHFHIIETRVKLSFSCLKNFQVTSS